MIGKVGRLLPAPLRGRLAAAYLALRGTNRLSLEPHNMTSFHARACPGPLVTEVFDKIRRMPGWFNIDDCAHFWLILSHQTATGTAGDVLEIGCYYGRSTSLLARCLQPSEKLVVCDAFQFDTEDGHRYEKPPSRQQLVENILRVNPGFSQDRLEIHECLSRELELKPDRSFRFAHVDGGHTKEVALADINLCAKHMLSAGVIVVDDHAHPDFPEVSEAIEEFLATDDTFRVLADLSRHGAIGRKLYLIRK